VAAGRAPPPAGIIVNVQGDEPAFMARHGSIKVVEALQQDSVRGHVDGGYAKPDNEREWRDRHTRSRP